MSKPVGKVETGNPFERFLLAKSEKEQNRGKILSGVNVNLTTIRNYDAGRNLLKLIGNWLEPKDVNIPSLKKSIESTVLISAHRNGSNGHATGIIVNYNDKKYLVTASHVIGPEFIDETTTRRGISKLGNQEYDFQLREEQLVYDYFLALQKGLPVGDIAVYKYDGPLDGVTICEEPLKEFQAFSIGYPGLHKSKWFTSLTPLLSFGYTNLGMRIGTGTAENKLELEKTIIFTGIGSNGNSGGGLFNLNGELVGICSGPEVFPFCVSTFNLTGETGNGIFSSIQPIFEELKKRSIL